jgi:hypothetical protein
VTNAEDKGLKGVLNVMELSKVLRDFSLSHKIFVGNEAYEYEFFFFI